MAEEISNIQVPKASADLTPTEKERIKAMHDGAAVDKASFKFVRCKSKDGESNVAIEIEYNNKNLTFLQNHDLFKATMFAITGSTDCDYNAIMLDQLVNACDSSQARPDSAINSVIAALLAMAPRDIYEGMLCKNLVALEDNFMAAMARVAKSDTIPRMEANMNAAAKLCRLLNETIDALNKYRRKGQQTVTVQHQHVNVGNGGQAVVAGQFTPGGETDAKK